MSLENSVNNNYAYDVIIIGCGPAGSITARYIQPTQHNLRVLLIDRKKEIGVPIQCGEGILGFIQGQKLEPFIYDINNLFECPKQIRAHRIDQIQLITPKHKIIEIPVRGNTIYRDLFDQYLAQRAQQEGAIIKKGISFLGFKNKHTIITSKGEIKGKIIVGADGAISSVAKSSGLQQPTNLANCVIAKIKGDFNDHTMKFFQGKMFNRGYGWIFSKGDHANVGLGTEFKTRSPLRKILDDFIEKELRAKKSDIIFRGGGIVPMGGPIPRTIRDNILIVGDAAGMVDPLSGAGIGSAMIAGRECGTAILKYFIRGEDLYNYERNWRNTLDSNFKRGLIIKKTLQWAMRYNTSCEVLIWTLNKLGITKLLY